MITSSSAIVLPYKLSPSGDLSQFRASSFSSRSLDRGNWWEYGVRDLGGLESALVRPHATFGETEFYPDIFSKAVVLMDGLTRNHAFIDGNKRISISTAVLFPKVNDYHLTASNLELEEFAIHVTTLKPSIEEIVDWFRDNTVQGNSR